MFDCKLLFNKFDDIFICNNIIFDIDVIISQFQDFLKKKNFMM